MDHVKRLKRLKKLLLVLALLLLAPTAALAQTGTPSQKIWVFTSDPWTCNLAQEGSIYENQTLHELRYCNGSSWVNIAGLISGTTNTLAKFTSPTALGDATPLTSLNSVAADNSTNFLRVTGTLPASPSAPVAGTVLNVTSAGAVSFEQRALSASLQGGFTGASESVAVRGDNFAAGIQNVDALAGGGNIGVGGYAIATTTGSAGSEIGALGYGLNNGTGKAFGVVGTVHDIGASGSVGFGVTGLINAGLGVGSAAGLFILGGGAATMPILSNSAVLVAADNVNGNTTIPIFQTFTGHTTPTATFTIQGGGDIQLLRTMTAAGTTGAQTINKPAGSVNFAAAATTLVVTNSLATTTSGILALALANDASCWVKDVERAAGSFTIRMVAACTAETAVYWEIRN